MDLSKLPPLVAISLGLIGCEVNACLSPPYDGATTGTGTDTETTDVGPCLSPPEPETTTSTGPCLGMQMDSTGSDTGSGSDTGTGSGSDTGTGSGSDTGTGTEGGTSSGGVFDEPPPSTARAAAVERVLARGTLPADVLDRLRALTGPAKGQTKG
jgi:hypothetical protein